VSFVEDKLNQFGGFVEEQIDALTGKTAAEASVEAAQIQAGAGQSAIEKQEEAAQRAQAFFDPFSGVAERGVEASSFLADPQAQFDFLKNNPLFQLALDNANRQTKQMAAAGGRLSAGDTLQQLSNNVLLSSSPLIDRQRQDINQLLNLGTGVAGARANIETGRGTNISNLLTDIGNVQAGGLVGGANAQTQGTQNLLDLGFRVGDFFNKPDSAASTISGGA
jgi:hypothetical protein